MRNFFAIILRTLNVRYNIHYVNKLIGDLHLDNSMFSIQQFLNHYNIKSTGMRFKQTPDLTEICPFIANINFMWALVISANNNVVTFYNIQNNGAKQEIPTDVFIKRWNKKALIIESSQNATEPNYIEHQRQTTIQKFKLISSVVCFAMIGLFCLYHNALILSPAIISLLIVNIIGSCIGYLLLKKQLHKTSNLADKLCSLIPQNVCEEVMESSDFFGIAKFGEIGFGYFTVNVFFILCMPSTLPALAILALCVLPFSFWSIWFQKYRVKQWCVLCLLSLFIMWIQATLYVIGGFITDWNCYDASYLIPLLASYVLAVYATSYYAKLIERISHIGDLENELFQVLSNNKVIDIFMNPESRQDVTNDNCSSIIFGPKNSAKRLTVFSNPYCGPCASLHETLSQLPIDTMQVQFVFTYFSEEKSIINKYLIAAYQQLDINKSWQVFSEWFAEGRYTGVEYFSTMNLNIEKDDVTKEFNKHSDWLAGKPFLGTPTLLMNGREIKAPYNLNSINYIN